MSTPKFQLGQRVRYADTIKRTYQFDREHRVRHANWVRRGTGRPQPQAQVHAAPWPPDAGAPDVPETAPALAGGHVVKARVTGTLTLQLKIDTDALTVAPGLAGDVELGDQAAITREIISVILTDAQTLLAYTDQATVTAHTLTAELEPEPGDQTQLFEAAS